MPRYTLSEVTDLDEACALTRAFASLAPGATLTAKPEPSAIGVLAHADVMMRLHADPVALALSVHTHMLAYAGRFARNQLMDLHHIKDKSGRCYAHAWGLIDPEVRGKYVRMLCCAVDEAID